MEDHNNQKFVFSNDFSSNDNTIVEELSFYEIDNCFMALIDEKMFENFKQNIAEDQFCDADELIDSFKKLVLLFHSLGYRFDDDEKRRIHDLIDINITNNENVSAGDVSNAQSLYTYLRIMSDPSFYKEYLSLNDDFYVNGILKRTCERHLISDLRKFRIYPGHFSSLSSDRVNRFSLLSKLEEGDYAFIPDDYELDSELENKIMENFPSSLVDDEDIAKEIYNRLNKYISLIPRQYTEGFQDTSFYQELVDLSAKDINLDNNGVTCGVWCDLYWKLVNKYTNLKCFVCGKKDLPAYHRYVVMLTNDGRVLSADGTNVIYDRRNKTKMCDITRSKLGLTLNNFGSFEKLKKDDRFSFDNSDCNYDCDMEMYRIVQLIGSKEAKDLINEVLNSDVENFFYGKFRVICQIIFDNKDLDNVSLHSLCKNLLYICFDANERDSVKFNDLYTKELSDYPFVMSFSIKQNNNDYIHYLFDTSDGFHKVSSDELSGLLETGRLIKIDSNDKIIGLNNLQY